MIVVKTRQADGVRTQYLGCPSCGVYGGSSPVITLSDKRTRIDRDAIGTNPAK